MTTVRQGLDRAELVTTALAVVISSLLYVAFGHPYLARGVVGDLLGLATLTAVVVLARRRGRHEAAVCLVAIGAVSVVSPDWPLRVPGVVWWSLVAVGVAGYAAVRRRVLCEAEERGRRLASG